MRAIPALEDFIQSHISNVIFPFETLVHFNKVEEIKKNIGFDNCFVIGIEARSKGFVMLWKNNCTCQILIYSMNFINVKVTCENN